MHYTLKNIVMGLALCAAATLIPSTLLMAKGGHGGGHHGGHGGHHGGHHGHHGGHHGHGHHGGHHGHGHHGGHHGHGHHHGHYGHYHGGYGGYGGYNGYDGYYNGYYNGVDTVPAAGNGLYLDDSLPNSTIYNTYPTSTTLPYSTTGNGLYLDDSLPNTYNATYPAGNGVNINIKQ